MFASGEWCNERGHVIPGVKTHTILYEYRRINLSCHYNLVVNSQFITAFKRILFCTAPSIPSTRTSKNGKYVARDMFEYLCQQQYVSVYNIINKIKIY